MGSGPSTVDALDGFYIVGCTTRELTGMDADPYDVPDQGCGSELGQSEPTPACPVPS